MKNPNSKSQWWNRFFVKDEELGSEQLKLGFGGLRGKVLALLAIPILFMVGISLVILSQINFLSKDLSHILEETVPALTGSKKLQLELTRIESLVWGLQLHKDDEELTASHLSNLDSSISRFDTSFERYMELKIGEVAGNIRAKLGPDWSQAKPKLTELIKMGEEKKFEQIPKFFEENIKTAFHNLKENIQNVELNNADVIEVERENTKKTSSRATMIAIGSSAFAVLVSLFVSFFMVTRISTRLSKLSVRLQSEADSTKNGATLMASSSENLAQSATETASAVQEISSAVEEIRGMVERSSQNASRSLQSSQTNVHSAQMGRSQLDIVNKSFDEIRSATDTMVDVVDQNNKKIDGIMKVIQEISAKTAMINDIVFQTKLLSFNASVEAARAGEHGKGFAIVAEEVGNLARSSGSAALEISQLLEKSNGEVNSILQQSKKDINQATESTLARIKNSERALQESFQTLDQIGAQSEEINRLVQEIAQASSEQTRGVSEIATSIRQINESTSHNMQNGQEIAGSASEIMTQVESVNDVIRELRIVVRGAA